VTIPRRRVLRPAHTATVADLRRQAAAERRRAKLAKEREALNRWMGRLRRAFHAVEAAQRRIGRLERAVSTNEAS
jgi:hypothetical protein